MKLVLQSDNSDLVASIVPHTTDIDWFKNTFNLHITGTTNSLTDCLREAGVKRMRLSKKEELSLDPFVRGETYTDKLFMYHFVFFE